MYKIEEIEGISIRNNRFKSTVQLTCFNLFDKKVDDVRNANESEASEKAESTPKLCQE